MSRGQLMPVANLCRVAVVILKYLTIGIQYSKISRKMPNKYFSVSDIGWYAMLTLL